MEVHDLLHGRTGRKKRGGRKEICLTFSDLPPLSKKIFPEKLSKLVVKGGSGGGGRNDYEKFLLDSIFPTKLTEFVPFIFISQYCPTVKRILPDWLCLPNKLWEGGGGGLPPPPPGTPMICYHVNQAKKLPAIIVLIYKSIN